MAVAWRLSRRTIPLRSISRLCIVSKPMSTNPDKSQMDQPLYISPVDAEPLHRYRQGGYHPVTLGEYLKAGRYKVLHKLGWGGYSTVWAARDQRLYKICDSREEAYVAVKISVAEREHNGETRELQTMKQLASCHPRLKHTVHLLDHFDLKGPNGSHTCLVYELLGPNIPDTIDAHFPDGRLPGKLAKAIAKQSLIGLDSLHQQDIGHGGRSLS
ncbi:protein kinase [Penicillium capsulatum]|uniref:non-specific serine/threonine protein kinase n=1 Tax=Penicillium capsulatum TaxID=69766 RepID=A0A9W9LVC0_9EURO|nr:protein kinase [Penicillium capsulatum]